MDRRSFLSGLGSLAVVPPVGWSMPYLRPLRPELRDYPLYDEALAAVIPEGGVQTRIALRDSVLQLIDYRVIDRGKFFALARGRGAPPDELASVFSEPSPQPMRLTPATAAYFVNLLWPLGLSNYMAGNQTSPINGDSLDNFASTGGWTLGAADKGGDYFNAFPIVPLTPQQEYLVINIAKSTYRPCCDNSTFFQDCNHGSALLGVLQLGASQGLSKEQLYEAALAFNSFWFPDTYVKTALYFKVFKQTDWRDVDPEQIMGFDYSALSSWRRNVEKPLAGVSDLIPPPEGGAGCGV